MQQHPNTESQSVNRVSKFYEPTIEPLTFQRMCEIDSGFKSIIGVANAAREQSEPQSHGRWQVYEVCKRSVERLTWGSADSRLKCERAYQLGLDAVCAALEL